jgi:thymidylate synthase (FAD)
MHVELIEFMGSDLSIVNAARVSFSKESTWDVSSGKRHTDSGILQEKDAKLLKYLAEHNHWSPFAHTAISLRVKAPIFVARQLGKHQVGLVWNEVSRRYVDDKPEFYFPDSWRGRPENAKQGSSGVLDKHTNAMLFTELANTVDHSKRVYSLLIKEGVAPEQARMVLPQNMYTEWIWTGSLMAFVRVCKLRLDEHTQKETRDVAGQIADICRELFPTSFNALVA